MKPWKEMRGLSVVDQVSGKRIGKVEQVWLHAGGRQMQGISIRGRGLRARRLYASTGEIRLLGDVSLIVARTGRNPFGPGAWCIGQDVRVYSVDGEKIGWMTDALIEESTGNVAALEVSRGYIDDLRRGREWVSEFTIRPCGVIAVVREPGQGPGPRDG